MTYKCLPFYKLNLDEVYAIMALRQEVFVVEQNCPYLDADGSDQEAWHLMGFNEEKKLMAYTRLLPQGISYKKYSAIGRVVTSPSARGLGAGKKIMETSIQWMEKLFPNQPIKISAQVYLLKFYNELGFQEIGEEYLEDDIPHIAMLYDNNPHL